MATEIPRDIDTHIVSLLTRISALRDGNFRERPMDRRMSMSNEMRSLEFWRAVAVECFATFLFVLVVLGAAASSNVYGSGLSVLATSIASGFAIAAIYLIFGHISGGHVNPAVSISFALSRRISLLRAGFYLVAQCGGGIAGAAMLYGVNGAQAMPPTARLIHGIDKILLVEMSLSVFIVLAHLNCESAKKISVIVSTKPAGVLAAAYTAATLVSSPYLNPARALGPAFVTNRWEYQWVYWVGPISGGALAAMIHEYVLSPKHSRDSHDLDDIEGSSMRSDEDPYDDLDNKTGPKFPGGYATYRPVAAGASASIYSPPPTAIERVESIYGGTKSLYCKSPPLTRANLNRSQSVYAKSSASGRDGFIIPKPGPLVPAQSLYQMRIGQSSIPGPAAREQSTSSQGQNPPPPQPTQNHNSTNQNMQNQLQQCTQSIYGIRGVSTSVSTRENGIYGVTTSSIYGRAPVPPPPGSQNSQGPSQINQQQQQQQQQNSEAVGNSRRPESMYGHVSRRSDDSAYGSYQGSNRGNYGKIPGPPPPPGWSHHSEQNRPSPVAGPLQQNQNQQSNYQRNSPNPQY